MKVKRIFDLFFSILALIIFSPLFFLIICIVALNSKGGPFYVQKRIGKNGKEFVLIKFRTMKIDSDKSGLITIGGRDPRITQIGYFLRKYKLDEIPQIFNIIQGNMSFVGPRPEVKKYVDLYNSEQLRVLSVKPGLTDYASLKFINENEILGNSIDPENTYINEIMPQKIKLGLKYIDEMSLKTDISIIFRTIQKIIK